MSSRPARHKVPSRRAVRTSGATFPCSPSFTPDRLLLSAGSAGISGTAGSGTPAAARADWCHRQVEVQKVKYAFALIQSCFTRSSFLQLFFLFISCVSHSSTLSVYIYIHSCSACFITSASLSPSSRFPPWGNVVWLTCGPSFEAPRLRADLQLPAERLIMQNRLTDTQFYKKMHRGLATFTFYSWVMKHGYFGTWLYWSLNNVPLDRKKKAILTSCLCIAVSIFLLLLRLLSTIMISKSQYFSSSISILVL